MSDATLNEQIPNERSPEESTWGEELASSLRGPAVGLVLAALTVFLGFNAGGFFPGSTATAAIALCFLVVLGAMLVSRPFESFTPAFFIPLGLLAGFAAWTLISASWSGATGRALLEFDRVLLYVLAFVFFGMLVPGKRRLEWGLRGFVLAAVILCTSGWITRVAADVWPISLDVQPERLSFPITYWNALGLLASLALVACFHIAAGDRQSRLTRVLGAAAIPLLASTLLLTFSRASLLLVPLGLIAYALLALPRRLPTAALAVAPTSAVALIFTYRADLVSSAKFASPAAISQGHDLALVVGLCVLVAAVLRALLIPLDRRLDEWQPPQIDRAQAFGVAGAGLIAVVALAFALGAPSWVGDKYDNFVNGDVVGHHADPRARLTSAGNNGRIPQWEAAVEAFEEKPWAGNGAGTYELSWAKTRPYGFTVIDAHSIYVEVLGELGIIGFLLIGGAIAAIFVGLARRLRGEDRHIYAVVIALGLIWAIHAGVDWDWEMPVVTLWFFALAGLGLSKPVAGRPAFAAGFEPGRMVRIVAALLIGVLAVTPAAIAISQSHLEKAVAEFDRGECDAAISASLDSLDALKARPEPYEVIGYCDARLGQTQLSLLAMENAVDHDPNSWATHYGLAIVRAAGGLDPMPQLYLSRSLNPLEPLVRSAIRNMRGKGPQEWERRAKLARLPI
jgi:O-antigen ligase